MPNQLTTKQQPPRMIIVTETKRKRGNPFWDRNGPTALLVIAVALLLFTLIMTPLFIFVINPAAEKSDKASAECVAMGAKPFEVRNTTLCAMPDGTVVLPKSENK